MMLTCHPAYLRGYIFNKIQLNVFWITHFSVFCPFLIVQAKKFLITVLWNPIPLVNRFHYQTLSPDSNSNGIFINITPLLFLTRFPLNIPKKEKKQWPISLFLYGRSFRILPLWLNSLLKTWQLLPNSSWLLTAKGRNCSVEHEPATPAPMKLSTDALLGQGKKLQINWYK